MNKEKAEPFWKKREFVALVSLLLAVLVWLAVTMYIDTNTSKTLDNIKVDFTYESAAGRYRVFWETLDKTTLHLTVEVPFGCQAELKLPYCSENALRTLEAGCFDITYTTESPMARSFHADMPMIELLKTRESRVALEALVPGISRTPDSMIRQTLRQVLASLERKNEQQIAEIDARLRMV